MLDKNINISNEKPPAGFPAGGNISQLILRFLSYYHFALAVVGGNVVHDFTYAVADYLARKGTAYGLYIANYVGVDIRKLECKVAVLRAAINKL